MNTVLPWGCLVFVGAFGLYLGGVAPHVSVGDSGEFITAASTLGVPHPSGFPTYVVTAKLFSSLMPWGNGAYRVNLFSAAAGASTLAIFFALLAGLRLRLLVCVSATALLAGASALIVSSHMTEVFALHALIICGVLWCIATDRMEMAGLLFGLGAGNHQTLALLVPAVVLVWRNASWRRWAGFLLAGAAGATIYAVLYVRAQHHPFLDVGHPDTLNNLWRVFTRADFGQLTLALGDTPERNVTNTWLNAQRFIVGLYGQVGIVGLALGVWGIVRGLERKSRLAQACVLGWIVSGPFFFWLGNLPFDAQSIGLLERFYLMPVLCWAALAAFGLEDIAVRAQPVIPVMLLFFLVMTFRQSDASSMRSDFALAEYARNLLKSLPPNARLIIDGGDDTFYSLASATQVEHLRPDVDIHDRGGVVFAPLYGDDFRRLDRDSKEVRRRYVEQSLAHTDRPLYFSTMNPQIMPGVTLHQVGLLYSVDASTAPSDMSAFYDYRGIAPWQVMSMHRPQAYRDRALRPIYSYQRAIDAATKGQWSDALHFLSSAQTQGPDVQWLIPNVAATLHQWAYKTLAAGQWATAIACYSHILDGDQTDLTALLNRGASYERAGDLTLAVADYAAAIQAHPDSPQAHFNLAAISWRRRDWPAAIREFGQVVSINPAYPQAQAFLARAKAQLGS